MRNQNYKNKNTETKYPCYYWLICYISEIVKMVGSVKDKIMSLFKTNTTKNYIKPARISNVYGGRNRPRKQSEDKIIKAIDERIFRDIKNTFEKEKEEDN